MVELTEIAASDILRRFRGHFMSNFKRVVRAMCATTALVTLNLGGCAGVHHQGIAVVPIQVDARGQDIDPRAQMVANRKADAGVDGIRYYDTSLYVLIYPDGKGGVRWQILELPDQTKLRAVKPFNAIAQLDATFVFAHGTLVSTAEQVDTTAVPRAAIAALAKVMTSLAPMLFAQAAVGAPEVPSSYSLPPVQLYKVVMNNGVAELNGGPGDRRISVALNLDQPEPAKDEKKKEAEKPATTSPSTQPTGGHS